jgi:hypothetical protein
MRKILSTISFLFQPILDIQLIFKGDPHFFFNKSSPTNCFDIVHEQTSLCKLNCMAAIICVNVEGKKIPCNSCVCVLMKFHRASYKFIPSSSSLSLSLFRHTHYDAHVFTYHSLIHPHSPSPTFHTLQLCL